MTFCFWLLSFSKKKNCFFSWLSLWGRVYFCTIDGFFTILKKALSDLKCKPLYIIIIKKCNLSKELPHWRIGLSNPKKLPLPNQTWNQRSFGNHQIHKVAVFFHQLNSWCRNNFHKVQPEKYGFVKISI